MIMTDDLLLGIGTGMWILVLVVWVWTAAVTGI